MNLFDKQLLKHVISMVQPNEPNLQKRLISCNMALLEAFLYVNKTETEEPTMFKAIVKINQQRFRFLVTKQNGLITNVQISEMDKPKPEPKEFDAVLIKVSKEQFEKLMN